MDRTAQKCPGEERGVPQMTLLHQPRHGPQRSAVRQDGEGRRTPAPARRICAFLPAMSQRPARVTDGRAENQGDPKPGRGQRAPSDFSL